MTPIFPIAYLPPVSYMVWMSRHEKVRMECWETFPKQTIRNRCFIATANGVQPLVVPVKKPHGNHTLTHEVEICYAEKWNINHWRAIEAAYNSSPYFLYYKDGLEKVIMSGETSLLRLDINILEFLKKSLKLKCEIELTQDYISSIPPEEDLRDRIGKKHSERMPLETWDQVFEDRIGFQPEVSILDLLFNLGPEAKDYLLRQPLSPLKEA